METKATSHAADAPLLTDAELLEWIEEEVLLLPREGMEEWMKNDWVRTNPTTKQMVLVFERVLPLIAEWSPRRLPAA